MTTNWITVATPTIMDGLVVRWYASEQAALQVEPHVSASRNRVQIHIDGERAQSALPAAENAYRLLAADYNGNYDRVKAMATHHHPFFGGALEPLVTR